MTSDAVARAEAEARFGGTAKRTGPTPEQRALNETVTEKFVDLAAFILREIPEGRERATALTELKTSKMYAVDAIFQKES